MTLTMSNFTYRQKEITIHLLCNIATLIVFAVYRALYRGPHNWVPLFLFLSWYLPLIYSMPKIHAADDIRIDERDYQIEAAGTRDGLGLMSFGIFLLLWLRDINASMILNELFLIWILSRIVIDGKKLRLYAGHASWFPDSLGEWSRRQTLNRIRNPSPRLRATAARFDERKKREGGQ
jgi:hypothetical protein